MTPREEKLSIEFPCECTYWCHVFDLDGVYTSHHENCPKRDPLAEAKVIIHNLIIGIEAWASEEDGVYDEVWHDYLHALLFLQKRDKFFNAIHADKKANPERYK